MGGHAAGEVASRVAVDAIDEFVELTGGNEEITWPFGLDDTISYDGNRLKTAVRHANTRVIEATRESAEYEGMATTVAAVLVDGDIANLAHVGDSRIYLWNGEAIEQLTRDHSWVNEQIQNGAISPEQARSHPLRNVVTRALGGRADLVVDIQSRRMARRRHAAAVLGRPHHDGPRRRDRQDPARVAGATSRRPRSALVGEANAKGGEDNITVVLLKFGGLRRVLPQAQRQPGPRPRVGRYLITGRIGKGGMGMVYRGLDEPLEREVAVKTLVAEGSFDAESRRRFEVEAQGGGAAAAPEHRHGLRAGRGPRHPVHRDGDAARRRPRVAAALGRGAAARREARHRRAGLPRARLRARARHRAPRHQAEQHAAARRRHREDHGLRHRQARGRPPHHQDRDDGRHGALHEPRAGARPAARRPHATSSRPA